MNDLTAALQQLIPSIDSIRQVRSIGGGCISDAKCVTVVFQDGQETQLFVKSNSASFLDNFQAECDGLKRLHDAGAITIPEPLAIGVAGERSWLVLQWIETGHRGANYFNDFARRLAQLHRVTLGTEIGLDRDNYLGSAKQINQREDDWSEFFATHRIGYQIRWAASQGVDDRLRQDCEQIMRQMGQLLSGRQTETSLLHGDLWSGNYLCDADGGPVLIDPAVYYGCREAEFGMLKLFGGCPPSFYDAYQEQFPMNDGWQRRVQVYVLYHLLNHLNLFGSGYLGQCRSLAAEILRA